MIRAEQVRFQYKKRDVDGNVIATEEILKGVDLTIKKVNSSRCLAEMVPARQHSRSS